MQSRRCNPSSLCQAMSNQKIDSFKKELRSDIARVEQKVDFAKEFEVLKIKVAELERRG